MLRRLPRRRWKKYCRRCEEFHFLGFTLHLHVLKPPFCATAAGKRQKVLVVQVHSDLIQVWLQRNRSLPAQKIRLRPGFLGKLVQVVLSVVRAEEGTSAMARARVINRPDVR